MAQRYLVTARKYRPKLFKELAAQEHVSSTLKNAVRLDRLSHAYLFSGPRGVGKTTAARILAKAINCQTPLEDREDEAEPCRSCDSCQAFEEGRSLDIIELDAASNNKVDDVRDLRETVRIPPQGSKKKVYIIDEVHMLSKQAFNALLKTLEEPPDHALFIFATTEPNKVLPTILSRCQRFDFRRISVPVIVERLKSICDKEDISYDEDALLLLARKGNGALRDAFSAFDQAVALCGADLQYDELARALGVVDVDLFFEVTNNIRTQNTAGMLHLVEKIVQAGYDFQEFLEGLSEHLRNALVACTLDEASLIESTDAVRKRYMETGSDFSEADLLRLLLIVGDARRHAKGSVQPRLQLEMTLLKLANMAHAADLREALGKLDALEGKSRGVEESRSGGKEESRKGGGEERRSGGKEERRNGGEEEGKRRGRSPDGPSSGGEDEEHESPRQEALAGEATPDDQDGASLESVDSVDSPEGDSPEGDSPEGNSPEMEEAPGPSGQSTELLQDSDHRQEGGKKQYNTLFNKPALSPSKKASDDTSGADPSAKKKAGKNGSGPPHGMNGGAAHNYEGGDGAAAVAEPSAQLMTTRRKLEEGWSECVAGMQRDRVDTATLMGHARPTVVADGHVVLQVPDAFHHRLLHNKRKILRAHIAETLDIAVERLDVAVEEKPAAGGGEDETADKTDPYEVMQKKREEDPAVEALFTLFGGEIVH